MWPTQALIDAGVATELEAADCRSGLEYDMGLQFKPSKVDGPPGIRWFDETARKWNLITGLPPFIPKPGVWVDVEAYFLLNPVAQTVAHDSIAINKQMYPIGQVHHAKQKWSPQTFYIHNAIQLDSDGKATPEGVQIKNWAVRAL